MTTISILPIVFVALYVLGAFLCFWAAKGKRREEKIKARQFGAWSRRRPKDILEISCLRGEYREAKIMKITAMFAGVFFLTSAIYIGLMIALPGFDILDEIKKLLF
ncbi:MAG: hypothetical protein FJZ04_02460 [Candidatus Moranbacteria bacterium]|nr:hypothetical protein [Candidatus Moranbacteria bacterium]